MHLHMRVVMVHIEPILSLGIYTCACIICIYIYVVRCDRGVCHGVVSHLIVIHCYSLLRYECGQPMTVCAIHVHHNGCESFSFLNVKSPTTSGNTCVCEDA